MKDYADLLDEAMPLSKKERGRLASAIQKRLEKGCQPKTIRMVLCRMVAKRKEGVRLELEDALGDVLGEEKNASRAAAKRPEGYNDPPDVSTAHYVRFVDEG